MEEAYKIEIVEDGKEIPWGVIGPAISEFNEQQAGDDQGKNLCFVLRAPDGSVAGGVIGATYWNWCYIDLLWVREDLRGQGYGHRLMELAEEEGRKRGAEYAHLDTFSFQAPDFYKRQGYQVFGELREFPPGHQRYYMKKSL